MSLWTHTHTHTYTHTHTHILSFSHKNILKLTNWQTQKFYKIVKSAFLPNHSFCSILDQESILPNFVFKFSSLRLSVRNIRKYSLYFELAKLNSEKWKQSLFYQEKNLVGLTPVLQICELELIPNVKYVKGKFVGRSNEMNVQLFTWNVKRLIVPHLVFLTFFFLYLNHDSEWTFNGFEHCMEIELVTFQLWAVSFLQQTYKFETIMNSKRCEIINQRYFFQS